MQLCKVCGGGKDLQAGKGKGAFVVPYEEGGFNPGRGFGEI
jgi:hypothetical protein